MAAKEDAKKELGHLSHSATSGDASFKAMAGVSSLGGGCKSEEVLVSSGKNQNHLSKVSNSSYSRDYPRVASVLSTNDQGVIERAPLNTDFAPHKGISAVGDSINGNLEAAEEALEDFVSKEDEVARSCLKGTKGNVAAVRNPKRSLALKNSSPRVGSVNLCDNDAVVKGDCTNEIANRFGAVGSKRILHNPNRLPRVEEERRGSNLLEYGTVNNAFGDSVQVGSFASFSSPTMVNGVTSFDEARDAAAHCKNTNVGAENGTLESEVQASPTRSWADLKEDDLAAGLVEIGNQSVGSTEHRDISRVDSEKGEVVSSPIKNQNAGTLPNNWASVVKGKEDGPMKFS